MLTPSPPPDGSFRIDGLVADSDNRLIVAGTAELPADDVEPSIPLGNGTSEKPRVVRVLRYLPNGDIDTGFGENGVVETDFGLPRPVDEKGRDLLPRPWLETTGVAVDGDDRIVLTGGASAGVHFGCFHDWFFNTLTYAAFVARLTEDGRPDPSFGGGDGIFGARQARENPLHAEFSAAPLIGPDAGVIYTNGGGPCPATEGSGGLARLTPTGESTPSFGRAGAIRWGATAAAAGPKRSTMALGWVSPWYYPKEPLRAIVRRFRPLGRPDRSYGHHSRIVITSPGGPGSALETLAVDARGRVLLGGTMYGAREFRDPGDRTRTRHRSFFSLVRLRTSGRLDRTFGPRGRIVTGFGALAVHELALLLDSQGRPVMVGAYTGMDRTHGLAVARYVIDR